MSLLAIYFTIGLLTATSICFQMHEEVNPEHTVIVFGFSGLRWDSMSLAKMPALERMKSEGLHIRRKHDPFQTESLPAFVTMITGQYPEAHGMLSNRMKDLKTGYSFDLNGNDPKWWKDVHPIWIHNQESGNKSALCYWPGHHISFNGRKSEYSCSNTKYADPFRELTTKGEVIKQVMPFQDRVDRVKYWLSLNRTERPSFIGVYFEEPLKSMIKYGVNSNETRKAFETVNNITESMMDHLKQAKLSDKINFVISGESGATDIRKGRDIFLDDSIQGTKFLDSFDIIDNGPITTIYPTVDTDGTQELLKIFKNVSKGLIAYNGSDLPQKFHYSKPYRTMPIILVGKLGYRINQHRNTVSPDKALMGYHGKYSSSHALLLAKGPAFKKGYALKRLCNVDIYNLLCKVLKIKPAKNAGDEKKIIAVLKKEKKWYVVVIKNVVKSPTRFTVAIIVALILLFTALYLIILSVTKATERCRHGQPSSRKFEVFTPNKAFRKTVVQEEGDNILLLGEEESDVSDLEEDLHFHIHKDADESLNGKFPK